MYLAKTKKPSLGRVAVSAFHNNSDRKVSNMECDPHRLTPSRRCSQPPAVRAAPCYYRIISSDKLQHLFHPTRGERSNAAFSNQSAAKLPSHAPHGSKARLRVVSNSRGSWRSHVHRTHTAQRVQLFKLQTRNVGGRGGLPSRSLGGSKGGGSLLKENLPLCPVQRHRRCLPSRAEHGIFFLNFFKKVKENKK